MNREIIAYAEHFVSFLIQNIEEKTLDNINEVILFGSAARGDADKGSDVDIFVNILREDRVTERAVSSLVKKFYSSQAFRGYWKLIGIENEIRCITGRLGKWKELEPSIVSDGLMLYGKYTGLTKGKAFVLVYWNKVKPESKRVLLSKKLYGYTYKNKKYHGLQESAEAVKLGSNCLLVPLETSKAILRIFKDLQVQTRTIHVSRLM